MTSPRPGTRAAVKARAQGRKPRRSWPRRILLAAGGAFLLGVIGLVIASALTPIPKANEAATAQASIVYFADGRTELGRFGDVNRESVKLDQVPKQVQEAFLAAEDRNFYTNNGVSPTGIARAVWVAVRGGQTQGGSTITQQYVKNYYLSQDQTLTRKLKEIMISLKVDRQLSKSEILESYLNTIYFGRGASGIQSASKAYFGKDVSKLTVSEGALLASVIRGPSFYDPSLGAEQRRLAQGRWNYVVDGMVTEGWLTQGQRASLAFPATQKAQQRVGVSGPNGYVVANVRNELLTREKLTDAEIDTGGLRIVTTIDKKKQDAAIAAVRERLPKEPKDLHPALVSITPGDGAIVAMYGGADFQKRQFNDATQGLVQAGSTYKIFGLIAALQSGEIGTNHVYNGASPQYFPEFRDSKASNDFLRAGGVRNFGGEEFGRLNLIEATAHSVNTIYAQVNIAATPKKTMEAARAAGVTSKLDPVYANILGTDTVKVVDMANAYATIAANGKRATPYLIRKVTPTAND
jgi:membrane peptidoglycan carboxypeptidase